jgi:isopenicillin-N N-acyltransferase like protein
MAAGFAVAKGTAADTQPERPKAPEHFLTAISGKPLERGRRYGQRFKEEIHWLLNKEVYGRFVSDKTTKDDLLRYAEQCLKKVKGYSPIVLEELGGMSEGAGLRLEEMGLIACHYEIGLGSLPKVERCTAMAVGPPDTNDGNTYVGQSHDYLTRWYGRSSMLLWQRPEGPSVLSMHYPGQWIWCGMNSAGIGLCGTAAEVSKKDVPGPAIGIPWYVMAAQILYQDTLPAAVEEVRRARQAGWSTLVLANADGDLANVEYTPRKTVVETTRGHMARVDFGSRAMLGATDPQPRCLRAYELLAGSQGRIDRAALQRFYGDHTDFADAKPQRPGPWVGRSPICQHLKGSGTLDVTLFNCTKREAYVCRGPACKGRWQTFRIEEK